MENPESLQSNTINGVMNIKEYFELHLPIVTTISIFAKRKKLPNFQLSKFIHLFLLPLSSMK